MKKKEPLYAQPMRVQVRRGSKAEAVYYRRRNVPDDGAIAKGVRPDPRQDLTFRGGRTVPAMQFRNIYLGPQATWKASDVTSIDAAITRALQSAKLNTIMSQYFSGKQLSCDVLDSTFAGTKPARLDEPGVQGAVAGFLQDGTIAPKDLDRTIFNLILPSGSVLALDDSDSLNGLGGYHGSVHVTSGGRDVTLYYSANVFSETLADGTVNGIPAFQDSWKNVVATLYHELNEFRTDADVRDAIATGEDSLLGWMSAAGQECGDEPISAARSLGDVFQEILIEAPPPVPIQFMYSNADHGPGQP